MTDGDRISNWDARQDYRPFSSAHRRVYNLLFSDGRAAPLPDTNGDTFRNNGFDAIPGLFTTSKIEISPVEVISYPTQRQAMPRNTTEGWKAETDLKEGYKKQTI